MQTKTSLAALILPDGGRMRLQLYCPDTPLPGSESPYVRTYLYLTQLPPLMKGDGDDDHAALAVFCVIFMPSSRVASLGLLGAESELGSACGTFSSSDQ